jgi:hypothetical protein
MLTALLIAKAKQTAESPRSFAPPSGLPAISPTGGEISRVAGFAQIPNV